MSLIAKYHLPGLAVEDRSIEIPLDWNGEFLPGQGLKLFYRVLCAPENVGRELPLLVYLQGGPGGCGPRVTSPETDGWIKEAVRHFRVILPDQRGTGRSSRVDGRAISRVGDARAQAEYLKLMRADSIVLDLEHLRLSEFGGARWATLGQSYGGFITLTYLSMFPDALTACFTCGGIPHVPASADEVYAHTFPRMAAKTAELYRRYPGDARRLTLLANVLDATHVTLPDGSPFSVRRLQSLGQGLGMKPGFERLHNLLDLAFADGDGTVRDALLSVGGDTNRVALSDGFLEAVQVQTSQAAGPLYWVLQELIYADGELESPLAWAASRACDARPEFSPDADPLLLTGEACFPWMFEELPALRPFAPAMEVLMAETSFSRLYDPDRLASNEVPLQAAVYFDDLYVDSGLQLDTLSRVGASHAWVTNEFEHDGLHGDVVFRRILEMARDRGDLPFL